MASRNGRFLVWDNCWAASGLSSDSCRRHSIFGGATRNRSSPTGSDATRSALSQKLKSSRSRSVLVSGSGAGFALIGPGSSPACGGRRPALVYWCQPPSAARRSARSANTSAIAAGVSFSSIATFWFPSWIVRRVTAASLRRARPMATRRRCRSRTTGRISMSRMSSTRTESVVRQKISNGRIRIHTRSPRRRSRSRSPLSTTPRTAPTLPRKCCPSSRARTLWRPESCTAVPPWVAAPPLRCTPEGPWLCWPPAPAASIAWFERTGKGRIA